MNHSNDVWTGHFIIILLRPWAGEVLGLSASDDTDDNDRKEASVLNREVNNFLCSSESYYGVVDERRPLLDKLIFPYPFPPAVAH